MLVFSEVMPDNSLKVGITSSSKISPKNIAKVKVIRYSVENNISNSRLDEPFTLRRAISLSRIRIQVMNRVR